MGLFVTACGDDPVDPATLTFAPELGVALSTMTRTASGLYLKDEVIGDGEDARVGDVVTVHYDGWLHTGQRFGTTRDVGTPFSAALGVGDLIDGWDEGLVGMRVGGLRLLVIPPQLAYGDSGAGEGIVPPNATVVFRVELLSVQR